MDNDVCYLQVLKGVEDIDDLKQAISEVGRRLGFTGFQLSVFYNLRGTGREEFFLSDCPADWCDRWARSGSGANPSPVLRAFNHAFPALWQDLAVNDPKWLCTAQSFGLAAGIAFPVRVGDEQASVLSLFQPPHRQGQGWPATSIVAEGHLLAVGVHDIFMRVLASRLGALAREPLGRDADLTERECECLVYAAGGATARQISISLDISEQTVSWHLKNVRRKLGVQTSREAFTRASERGMLSTWMLTVPQRRERA